MGTHGSFICNACGLEFDLNYALPADVADALVCNSCSAIAQAEWETTHEVKGFAEIYGRKPVAGKDYDPDGFHCQDDYEFFTSTGRYAPSLK